MSVAETNFQLHYTELSIEKAVKCHSSTTWRRTMRKHNKPFC